MLEVQEKAGFIPNVFLTLAHRPDEWRAFFAYHDALMLARIGITKAREGDDRRRDSAVPTTASTASSPTVRSSASTPRTRCRRSGRGQSPQGGHQPTGKRRC